MHTQLSDGIVRHATSSNHLVLGTLVVLVVSSIHVTSFSTSLALDFAIAPSLFPLWQLGSVHFHPKSSFSCSALIKSCLALKLRAELKEFAAFTDVWVQTPQLWGSARLQEVSRAGMWGFIFGPAPRSSWIYPCSSWLINAGCLSFTRKNKFRFFADRSCRHKCCRNVMEPSLASW